MFFSDEQLATLRGLSLMATARNLGHSWWQLPILYYQGRRWMSHHVTKLKAYSGMPRTIRKLHKNGAELYIVSSNSPENINKLLSKYKIKKDFVKVYGNVGFGGKTRILRRVVRQNNLSVNSTYYVADEPRDIKATKKAGLISVGVTWGYSSVKTISENEPDHIVRRPRQLLKIFS